MHNIKKIIFAAEQIGGLDAILPVIKKIQDDKNFRSIVLLGNKIIYSRARKEGLKSLYLLTEPPNKLESIIKKEGPDLFFTDTYSADYQNSIDKKIVKFARATNKPSVSIIDSWMNYKERFGKNLECVPNYVLAIDRRMKNDLEKIGIPSKKIIITGSPRFDKFSKIKKSRGKKGLIIFYSEPAIAPKDFENIAKILKNKFPKNKVMIKFHPTREKDTSKYDTAIRGLKMKIVKARPDAEALELSKKAELVVGLNSITLFDAALLGRKVFVYKPDKNILVEKTDRGGKIFAKYAKSKSTEKAINLIKSILR